jgi:hypothetical protein
LSDWCLGAPLIVSDAPEGLIDAPHPRE